MKIDSPGQTFSFKLVSDNESIIDVGVNRSCNFYFVSEEKITSSVKCAQETFID